MSIRYERWCYGVFLSHAMISVLRGWYGISSIFVKINTCPFYLVVPDLQMIRNRRITARTPKYYFNIFKTVWQTHIWFTIHEKCMFQTVWCVDCIWKGQSLILECGTVSCPNREPSLIYNPRNCSRILEKLSK